LRSAGYLVASQAQFTACTCEDESRLHASR
jgi:hypothetical protein